MADHITIRPLPGIWSLRAGGAVLGETKSALGLSEGEYPEVIYFPRADLAMAFFDATDKTSQCPWKGDATYYSVDTGGDVIANAAWSYEAPKDDMAAITGHLAFFPDDNVTVEEL